MEETTQTTEQPVKKRGRPKGSKNKPKVAPIEDNGTQPTQ